MAASRYPDFLFAFNDPDHSNRVLTLHYSSPSEVDGVTTPDPENSSPSEQLRSENVYVNSAILVKESDYFRAYFSGGFLESYQVSGTTDAKGVFVDNRDCMMTLLRAMYCGGSLPPGTSEKSDDLLHLLLLSDEYRVPAIMTSCANALDAPPLTLALVIEVFTLPPHIQESVQVKGLLLSARRFLEKNFPDLDEVARHPSSDFWSLPVQAVTCILSSPKVRAQSEDVVFFLILEWGRRRWPSEVSAATGSPLATESPEPTPLRASPTGGGYVAAAFGRKGDRAESLRKLLALVRYTQMSGECLLAVRHWMESEPLIDFGKVEEALRMKMMDLRAVNVLYGSGPPFCPRPGKRTGPAVLMWTVSEKEITDMSGMDVRESPDRVYVHGNWYCIELHKTGLGTKLDNKVQMRLAARDEGPAGHLLLSLKGKRAVEASCTIGTPNRSKMSKNPPHVVCFGDNLTPATPSPTKNESKLNPNPPAYRGELTVGPTNWGSPTKENTHHLSGPPLNELIWNSQLQRYQHVTIGFVFDDAGLLQITLQFQPLSSWL